MLMIIMCLCPVDRKQLDINPLTNSVELIWSTTTVAVGDTAVLHCSFDAIFQQLRSGNVRIGLHLPQARVYDIDVIDHNCFNLRFIDVIICIFVNYVLAKLCFTLHH